MPWATGGHHLPPYRRSPVQPRDASRRGRGALRPSQQVKQVSCSICDLHTPLLHVIMADSHSLPATRAPRAKPRCCYRDQQTQSLSHPYPRQEGAPPHTPYPRASSASHAPSWSGSKPARVDPGQAQGRRQCLRPRPRGPPAQRHTQTPGPGRSNQQVFGFSETETTETKHFRFTEEKSST